MKEFEHQEYIERCVKVAQEIEELSEYRSPKSRHHTYMQERVIERVRLILRERGEKHFAKQKAIYDRIEEKCGKIDWRKMEWDMLHVSPREAEKAANAALRYISHECARLERVVTFQEVYGATGLPDTDLYLGISLLVQRGKLKGTHPYSLMGFEHYYVYQHVCGLCKKPYLECMYTQCPHGSPEEPAYGEY
jgi:hypothetical protein